MSQVPQQGTLSEFDELSIERSHTATDLFNVVRSKRIIFIRHAQSVWNKAEKISIGKVSQFTKGMIESLSNKQKNNGGKYIDAPLSDTGILQAIDFDRFLQNHLLKITFKNMIKKERRVSVEINEKLSPKSPTRKSIFKYQEITKNWRRASTKFVNDFIPISNSKLTQETAEELKQIDIKSLLGMNHNSCVVSSNLRRAIDTSIIALSTRFQQCPLENVIMLSCLQEFGKGPDSMTKTKAHQIPKISHYTQQLNTVNTEAIQQFYVSRLDTTANFGPKKDDNVSRYNRMLEFCRWCFNRDENTIIVCGHSIWFQKFCSVFLLKDIENEQINEQLIYPPPQKEKKEKDKKRSNAEKKAKQKYGSILNSKLHNCGCVSFDLSQILKGSTDYYGIDPNSFIVIDKGFQKH